MSKAFEIDGLDMTKGTVVVELHKTLLVRLSEGMRECPERNGNRIHVPINELGAILRHAARVLYGERDVENCDLPVYDDAEAA